MAKFKVILVFFSLFYAVNQCYADDYNPTLLVFNFSQNNHTYNWENSLHRNFNFDRLRCNLDVNTNSTLLKRPASYWQENLQAAFNASYKIFDGISLVPYMSHSRNALQDKIVYTSELKLSTRFSKSRYFEINPFVSNKSIKRIGEGPTSVDKGSGYGFTASSKPIKILGNNLESRVSYEYYDLTRIPFSQFNARLGGLIVWGRADSLRWILKDTQGTTRYISRVRTPNEEGINDIIVRQVKVDRGAEYIARVRLPAEFIARMTGDLSFISYYYSPKAGKLSVSQSDNYTEGRNFNVDLNKDLFDRLKLTSGYRYRWGKEDYGKMDLDQWHETGELSLKMVALISPRDSTVFDGIVGVTSYYGLHARSNYDRDLKVQIYNLRHWHEFSKIFTGEFRLSYSNFYQSFTSSYNSANNNQNETYLLKSVFKWNLASGIDIIQGFEIQANYIIHDYIADPIDTPDRIFRRGSSETGFELKLSNRLAVMPGYVYRYEDYGKIIWDEGNWQQATGWDRRYHNVSLKLSYSPFRNIRIEPEYLWESKKEYDHKLSDTDRPLQEEQVIRDQRLDDLKRIAAINFYWNFSNSEYLNISYSRRRWESMGQEIDVSDFINVSVRYTF